jgi:hypothetical protein
VLKSQFRGLKKLIEGYPNMLRLGGDHSFNPHVYLVDSTPDVSPCNDGSITSDESAFDSLTMGSSCLSGGCAGISLHHTKPPVRATNTVPQTDSGKTSPGVAPTKAAPSASNQLGRPDSMEAYRPAANGRPGVMDRYYPQQPPGYSPSNPLSPSGSGSVGSRLHADAEEFEPSLAGSSLSSRTGGGYKYPPVYEEYYSRPGERERERAPNAPPSHLMRHQTEQQVERSPYPVSYRQGLVPPSRPPQEYVPRAPLPQSYQPAYRSAPPPGPPPRSVPPQQAIRDRFATERYSSGYTTSSASSSRDRMEYVDDRGAMNVYYSGRGGVEREREDPYRQDMGRDVGARRGGPPQQSYPPEYSSRPHQGDYDRQSLSKQVHPPMPPLYGGGRRPEDDGRYSNIGDRDYGPPGAGSGDRQGFFFSQYSNGSEGSFDYRQEPSDKGRGGSGEYGTSSKHERNSFGSTEGGYHGLDFLTEDPGPGGRSNGGGSLHSFSSRGVEYGDDGGAMDSRVMAYFLGDEASYTSK